MIKIYSFSLLVLALLCGCVNEENGAVGNSSSSSPVMLNVSISGIDETASNAESTRGNVTPQMIAIPMGKGLCMEGSLERSAASTRSNTALATGVTYRVIAFKQGDVSSTGYISYGDFTIGGSTSVSNFSVPAYGTYTFVCYSFNTSDALPVFDKNSLNFTVTNGSDLLYRKFDQRISNTALSSKLSILFKHTFSKITVVADASQCAADITAITATFSPSYNATLSLSDGTLTASGTSSAYTVPWGTITAGSTVSSTPFYAFTNGNISIAVSSVTIGGIAYTNRTATFNGIAPGVNYTIKLKFKPTLTGITLAGVVWAPGNLIHSGGTYSFAAAQESYTATSGSGYYFCWNTLDSQATSSSNTGATYLVSTDPCRSVFPAGAWRMPTSAELTALMNTGSVWGTKNGVNGRYFGTTTVPTVNVDNYVFLPAAGVRATGSTTVDNVGTNGYYWSSTPVATTTAYFLYFYSSIIYMVSDGRGIGFTVRCVSE